MAKQKNQKQNWQKTGTNLQNQKQNFKHYKEKNYD